MNASTPNIVGTRSLTRAAVTFFFTVALMAPAAVLRADPDPGDPASLAFIGGFNGDGLQTHFDYVDDGRGGKFIGGTFTVKGRTFTFGGFLRDGVYHGGYRNAGQDYSFTATVKGDTMTLISGAHTHQLTRVGAPAVAAANGSGGVADNPLSPAAPPQPPRSPASRPAGGLLFLRPEAVRDQTAGCDAATVLVPDGWKLESSVVWRMSMTEPAHADIHLFNPAGGEDMRLYPRALYIDGLRDVMARLGGPAAAAQFPEGCRVRCSDVRSRVSPADYIKTFLIPQARSDLARARVAFVKDAPEMANSILIVYQNSPAVTCKASRVRFDYASNGVNVEEDVYCAVTVLALPDGTYSWSANVQSYRAEKGRLDNTMGLFRAINFSIRRDEQWSARVEDAARIVKQMIQQKMDADAARAQIIAQAQGRISEMQHQMYEKSRSMQAESNAKWDDVFRGTQRAIDPNSGEQIEVPGGYDHGWTNPLGGKVMSNDPNYNPNQTQPNGGNAVWTPIKMVE